MLKLRTRGRKKKSKILVWIVLATCISHASLAGAGNNSNEPTQKHFSIKNFFKKKSPRNETPATTGERPQVVESAEGSSPGHIESYEKQCFNPERNPPYNPNWDGNGDFVESELAKEAVSPRTHPFLYEFLNHLTEVQAVSQVEADLHFKASLAARLASDIRDAIPRFRFATITIGLYREVMGKKQPEGRPIYCVWPDDGTKEARFSDAEESGEFILALNRLTGRKFRVCGYGQYALILRGRADGGNGPINILKKEDFASPTSKPNSYGISMKERPFWTNILTEEF